MGALDHAFNIVETVTRKDSLDGVLHDVAAVGRQFGLQHFCLSGIPEPGERIEPYLLLRDWSAEWGARYLAEDYVQDDPCIAMLRGTIQPFTWTHARTRLARSYRANLIMQEASELGLRDGLCIPIYSLHGFLAALSFGSDAPVDLSEKERSMLHLVALSAHNRVRELIGGDTVRRKRRERLTPREVECLKWAADGKTSWEISMILGISQHTADWYLSSAARKLKAVNRTQAVAEGFRRGLIR